MRRVCKFFSYVIGLCVIILVLQYAYEGIVNDLSMQPVNMNSTPDLEASEPTGRPPVYLISYASGREQYFRNQNAVAQYAINKGIDFILNYRISHIDKDFFEKHKTIFNEKWGAGMWLWKPYFILKTMENAPDGAVIVYVDSAFKIRKPIARFIDKMGENDVMLCQDQDFNAGAYVKGDSFYFLDCTKESCRHAPLIWSAIVVVRNSSASRSFIKKWLEACQDERALNATSYGHMPNYPEFKWHHFDQSVLSLIYHKHPDGIKLINYKDVNDYFIWFHRKAGPSVPNKIWYSVYGADPLINFRGVMKKLPSTSLMNCPPVVWLRKQMNQYWDIGG